MSFIPMAGSMLMTQAEAACLVGMYHNMILCINSNWIEFGSIENPSQMVLFDWYETLDCKHYVSFKS